MDQFIMSRKEREQLIIFKKLDKKEITQEVAAQMLNMSERGIRKNLKGIGWKVTLALFIKQEEFLAPGVGLVLIEC